MRGFIAVGVVVVLVSACGSSAPVAVPDVTGLRADDAGEQLRAIDLRSTYETDDGRGVWNSSNWEVTGQDPPAGTELEKRSTVTLQLTRVDGALHESDERQADSPVDPEIPRATERPADPPVDPEIARAIESTDPDVVVEIVSTGNHLTIKTLIPKKVGEPDEIDLADTEGRAAVICMAAQGAGWDDRIRVEANTGEELARTFDAPAGLVCRGSST